VKLTSTSGAALAAVGLGVALRLAWVLGGDFETASEATFYFEHARDLAAGRGYVNPVTGAPSAFLPPAYPFLLAVPFALFGASTTVAGIINALLAGLTTGMVFLLGREVRSPAAGVAGAWLFALFPSQVLYTSAVHSDHLASAATVAVVLMAVRVASQKEGRGGTVVLGAAIGIGSLASAVMLLFLLPSALAVCRRLDRASLQRTAMLVGGTLIVLAPWAMRNALQFEALAPVSTNGGVNLWIGNNPDSGPGWMPWAPGEKWQYPTDEAAADSSFRAAALRHMADEPGATVASWPGKLRHTFMQDYHYVRHFALTTRDGGRPDILEYPALEWLVNRYYYAVLLLAAGGLLLLPEKRLGVGVAAAVLLPSAVFFGLDRFHAPILPVASALAGAALTYASRVVPAARAARGRLAAAVNERLFPVPENEES
jgi:4-amino-4-deoxy-L-arabinose transferase-like glycosyltransferase